jgi:protein gp37
MSKSKIRWTQTTWNPVTGCTKLSEGCAGCYAYSMTLRHAANPRLPKYKNGWKVTVHPDCLNIPLKTRKPTLFFVNSMSDLFHKEVPEDFIGQVFDVMGQCPQHTFQVLTKRSERLRELAPRLPWMDNILMGVSVETSGYYGRIHDLLQAPAKMKFLSVEPLLSAVTDIPLDGIDWVIVGGESGQKARPMKESWVREVRDKCVQKNIPFFFKQWGGKGKLNKERGHLLDGQEWDQVPSILSPRLPSAPAATKQPYFGCRLAEQCIAYIQKKHISDLLAHEQRTGVSFNRMPNEQFMGRLSDELKLPVVSFVHQEPGIIRAAVYNPFDSLTPLTIDMPEDMFLGLPLARVEVNVSDDTKTA